MAKWFALALAAVAVLAFVSWRFLSGPEPLSVVVYVSHDQIFSEPIIKDFERDTGVKVRAIYDTEETKSTGAAKLGVVVHYSTHQVFDQLLADQAILMAGGAVLTLPPPIPVQRLHGFTGPTTRRGAECAPPTVKPLYLQTYFRLAASGLRGEAAAQK